jgi:hypothetical protein
MAVTSRLYGTDIWTITTTDEAVKTNNWSKKMNIQEIQTYKSS